jgi:hypothetical protein
MIDALNSRLLVVAALLGSTSLAAQMPSMAGMHHDAPAVVSATTRREIDSVVKALLPLGAPGAAANAGFRPAFGWIPTMGEHWVSRAQMVNGRQTNRASPSQLMFSKIAGKDSLVGAAYGYMTVVGDTVRPVLFDGAPPWHEHRDLAPDGMTLVMLHVWFVPSPDGPFAGTNPNLPFWALGLDAPDTSRMRDSAFKSRLYRASLALAEVADTTSILANLERRPEVRVSLVAHRDTIRALVPELQKAQKSKDAARWDRALQRAADQWDAIQATYVGSARTTDGRERIERFIAMLLGRHAE